MEMNFRLIVRYDMTEEVTDQYFATLGDADTVVTYLDKAMENGARLSFVVQKKVASSDIVTIDENGTDIGEWRNLRRSA